MAAAGKDAIRKSNSVTKGLWKYVSLRLIQKKKKSVCIPYPLQFHGMLPAVGQAKQFDPP